MFVISLIGVWKNYDLRFLVIIEKKSYLLKYG